ncbi:peptidylprolyl isomerase [Denitratisoma oestradiolicum]|uniref:Chaperone SurA n=1 Tax=Denitratisoma oestradiolicum TaxID=311182 RepID=A0A6S6YQE7_9PROT|nr:peptidylprolyl isomerase [Denitratisoma oestradiolicum]TWO80153.1 molecular chaperone SurA [Denitratisoma oestradiolicum]CAB1370002.1 Chaperone SurA [Denitratisoma oestradiolicum]
MKRVLPLLLIFVALSIQAQPKPPKAVEVDRLVAVVNDEAITLSELRTRLATVERQLRARNTPMPPMEVLERQLLERMIVDRVQMQMARDGGMEVSDPELDATLRRIAEGNRLSVPDFRAALEKDGISWSAFREEIRQEVMLSRLRDREVDSRVTVSDGEVDNYLSNAVNAGEAGVMVDLAHIVIRVPEQASPEQLMKLRTKAEQARAQLNRGEDFAKVAAANSDAPDAMSGGQVGQRSLDRLPALYAEALQKMQPGEVSTVLRSPAGFHIIKLLNRAGGLQSMPAIRQTRARHILIKVNELVSEVEAKRKLETVKERLGHGGDFAELAKLYSNDLSAAKGGDLGWLNQGDTVPEFERAMDSLAIGQVSDLVQSPFGWHLIQVQERRVDEGSAERKRLLARQALRERKAEEAYQDWVRQLRDRAYVEYRLEDK